jgi:ketosteroid isomerase-like protein
MHTLTPGDGQDLLARYKRAWESRDPDLAVELFREDAEYRPDPFGPALVGANAIREHWNQRVAEQANTEFDAERVWVAGSAVLASWHGAFTRRSTAERVRCRGFMMFELDAEGLVARFKAWVLVRPVGTDATVSVPAGSAPGGDHGW